MESSRGIVRQCITHSVARGLEIGRDFSELDSEELIVQYLKGGSLQWVGSHWEGLGRVPSARSKALGEQGLFGKGEVLGM